MFLARIRKTFGFSFFRYPLEEMPPYSHYILLSLDATEEISEDDCTSGLLLLDATWRYAQVMEKNIPMDGSLKRRRLPQKLSTAYPRRQQDCPDPAAGLASIEAIYCAYALMKRSTEGLLDHYHWKDSFLEKNRSFLLECAYTYERKTAACSATQ